MKKSGIVLVKCMHLCGTVLQPNGVAVAGSGDRSGDESSDSTPKKAKVRTSCAGCSSLAIENISDISVDLLCVCTSGCV